jgi:hypothetical protein
MSRASSLDGQQTTKWKWGIVVDDGKYKRTEREEGDRERQHEQKETPQ